MGSATALYMILPELCANLDTGGGVAYRDIFLVYTKQRPGDHSADKFSHSNLFDQLQVSAYEVSQSISFFFRSPEFDVEDLQSLPSQPGQEGPNFFINAASRNPSRIGIAGDGTLIDTLSSVLRRPWCVLELCCATSLALEKLLIYLQVASKIDPKAFDLAQILINHELECRTRLNFQPKSGVLGRPLSLSNLRGRKGTFPAIRNLCAALFAPSQTSYHEFWVRAICVCAFQSSISLSFIGCLLASVFMQSNSEHPDTVFETAAYPRQNDRNLVEVDRMQQKLRLIAWKAVADEWVQIMTQKSLPQLYAESMENILNLL